METDNARDENATQVKGVDKANESFDSVIQDIASETPEVQQHAVDAHLQREEEKASQDKGGETFDPEIHVINPDGSPKLTKTGKFRKKPGASKRAALNNPAEAEEKKRKKILDDQVKVEKNRIAAQTVQDLKRSCLGHFLEYEYSDERHALHVSTLESYFMSEGGVELSPLHGVMLLEGQMMMEALTTKKGATLVEKVKTKIAGFVIKFKGRKRNGAQPNSGANAKRENNSGNKVSAQDKGPNKSKSASS